MEQNPHKLKFNNEYLHCKCGGYIWIKIDESMPDCPKYIYCDRCDTHYDSITIDIFGNIKFEKWKGWEY